MIVACGTSHMVASARGSSVIAVVQEEALPHKQLIKQNYGCFLCIKHPLIASNSIWRQIIDWLMMCEREEKLAV